MSGKGISMRYNNPPFRYGDMRANVKIWSDNEGRRYTEKDSVENGSLLMSRDCEKQLLDLFDNNRRLSCSSQFGLAF